MAVATSQPERSENKSSQPDRLKSKSIYINSRIAFILLISLGINGLLTLCVLGLLGINASLANRPETLVQLQGGDTAIAVAQDANHREPEVVLETAKLWFEMTYGKSSVLPGGELDKGVKFSSESQQRVPTSTYRASYLLPAGFRTAFLGEFATQYIPNGFFDRGNRTSIVRIWDAYTLPDGNPRDGWTVEIVATVVDINGPQETREKPVNLSLKLLPVVPNVEPYGEEDPSELRRAVTKLRRAGLEITSIEPLDL